MEPFLILPPPTAPDSAGKTIASVHAKSDLQSQDDVINRLPDDVIRQCFLHLSPKELVTVEMLNKRLRGLVQVDAPLWQEMVRSRWGTMSNNTLLERGWKNLYAEKHTSEKQHRPWVIPAKSEVEAMFKVVRDDRDVITESMKTMTDMVTEKSRPPLAVVLLLDGSSSVTKEDFDSMKDFARALILNLNSCRRDSAIGIIQFNQSPRVIVPITNVTDASILQNIDNMLQLMGSTDIAAPIRTSYELLLEAGGRDRNCVVLLLSDGQTSTAELEMAQGEARFAAQDVGMRLFAFGVGRDVDEIGLHRIATSTNTDSNPQDGSNSNPNSPPTDRRGGSYFTLRRMERSML